MARFRLPHIAVRPARGRRRGLRDEDGQALVEAALTMPIIFAFVFTMIELCLAFYSYCLISESAREGTRYAIVHGATCETATKASCTASESDIENYTLNLGYPNLGGGTMQATASFPDTASGSGTPNQNPGKRVQVTVNYTFPITLPFVPNGSIPMQSTSVMYYIQ